MAHTTFHPFPRLPFELRTEIWEAACLQSETFQALHYITFEDSRQMGPLSHNWDNTKPKNKSVYLWAAGLWTACQESRKVVSKDWRKHPRPENKYDIYLFCSGDEANYDLDHVWPEEEGIPKAFTFYSKVDGEHWRQTVYPEQDLFCFIPDDWEFVARNWEYCSLLSRCSIGVNNIVMEFDPSWNLCLENKTESFSIEEVPASLECLLKLLFSDIRDNWYRIIKLIVRDVDWILMGSTIVSQIRDSDDEYVEVSVDEVEPYDDLDQRRIHFPRDRSPLDFFHHLDRVYYETLSEIYCEENMISPSDYERMPHWWLHIRRSFSILVPRANQVER